MNVGIREVVGTLTYAIHVIVIPVCFARVGLAGDTRCRGLVRGAGLARPAARVEGRGAVGEQPAPAPVLIVEDDADARELLETILVGDGLAVQAYASGTAASAWLEGHRPGLILLDLALPGMPGEEVAHTARRRYGRALPILVVTGGGAARERTEQADTFVYLTKPFEIAELLRVVHALLSPEPPFGLFITAPPNDGEEEQRDVRADQGR